MLHKTISFSLAMIATSFHANAIGEHYELQRQDIEYIWNRLKEFTTIGEKEQLVNQFIAQSCNDLFFKDQNTLKMLLDICNGVFDYQFLKLTAEKLFHKVYENNWPSQMPRANQFRFAAETNNPEILDMKEKVHRMYTYLNRLELAIALIFQHHRSDKFSDCCILFSNILSWVGTARCAIEMLVNPHIDYDLNFEKLKGKSQRNRQCIFPGLFVPSSLQVA
ncbi:MAG: hypothetical protein LBJ89_00150, partial [Holosporales bacterium]|nr:hypothetical protein [Holosporales bacterium]